MGWRECVDFSGLFGHGVSPQEVHVPPECLKDLIASALRGLNRMSAICFDL
jgi:hypothetical protein